MTNLIELKNITKVINNQIILNDINLKIKKNEFVTLLGPSGCGKTTILKIIGGFIDPSDGILLFDNENILNMPIHKRLINTVFQTYALFPHLNVFENIAFGMRIKDLNSEVIKKIHVLIKQKKKEIKDLKKIYRIKIKEIFCSRLCWLVYLFSFFFLNSYQCYELKKNKKELQEKIKKIKLKYQNKLLELKKSLVSFEEKEKIIKNKVLHYLKLVGLKGFEEREIKQLSGGQQQRVAIARALINEPKVLLLDEPLAALDLKMRQEMQYELKEIQKNSGITFIFVTHNQEEALTMSDKIVVINNGEIQQIGNPEDIYNEPANKFVAQFIGESNLISGIMKKDFLVNFDKKQFTCVDYGFKPNQKVDIVIRPEDIDIVECEYGLLKGHVFSISFKGVHWEVIVITEYRKYIIHTTDFIQIDKEVGIYFKPEDLHIMEVW
ncbi:ABC transporter ATP-binding protein [Candidatus Phytoplasma pini]|uniref:ABC-type spermidine/putrescine transport, ATPase component n=1 Tax=Candidatus Phytoplasma pini TaxID=267362 RepID=A0A559KIX0_9MOLU|nr:ABC transporter ATP-binding protein [Candidatus Phytoplasma pini]TVY12076.1 ABC-type spermidine/putrescine transport, ATPase component [Candidatus Phytoplasma pini]